MGHQAFAFGKSIHGLGEMEESLAGDGLHGDAFYKVSGGKSAAPAGPAASRKNVIASRSVIPERLRSPGSKKHSSGGANSLKKGLSILGEAEMLGGKSVHEFASPINRFGDKDCAGVSSRAVGHAAR